jgi:endonuclease-3
MARPADIPTILKRLEKQYGKIVRRPRFDAVDELICCILSQHSSDVASFPAFTKLKSTFPTWQQVVDAPSGKVADAIRRAGMYNQKSTRIQNALREIKERVGEYSLDHLYGMPWPEARAWLMSLPGVGPKTAAIVLSMNMGMPVIPVDTHVFRVGWRLGFYDKKIGEAKAHEVVQEIVPPKLAFSYHALLIQHGRNLCDARKPRCVACPVLEFCDYGKTQA